MINITTKNTLPVRQSFQPIPLSDIMCTLTYFIIFGLKYRILVIIIVSLKTIITNKNVKDYLTFLYFYSVIISGESSISG